MATHTFFEMVQDPLGNAEVMLDVCRLEYEKAGRAADVEELKNLTVRDGDGARLALLTVWNLPEDWEFPEDNHLRTAKRYAVKAMRAAVNVTTGRYQHLQLAS